MTCKCGEEIKPAWKLFKYKNYDRTKCQICNLRKDLKPFGQKKSIDKK